MKVKHVIGMQHMDDTFTTVPDWFVKYYEAGVFWIVFAVLGILTIVLIVLACRFYYQFKEIQEFLKEKEEE